MKPFGLFSNKPQAPASQAIAPLAAYWSLTIEQAIATLHTASDGLQQTDAERRLKQYAPNALKAQRQTTPFGLLLGQFKSPLVLILIFASIISAFVGEWTDASIVLAVVIGSTLLGFVQEYRASNAVEKLRSQVTIRSSVLRDNQPQQVPSQLVVPGDVVLLSAGSLIPADGIVLEANDFFVNQAVLTGETFPVEKTPGIVPAKASLAERTNSVFMGTSVRSGTARVLIAQTGKSTVFGQIAERPSLRPAQTEFERGVQSFGYLLTQVMLVMVVLVLPYVPFNFLFGFIPLPAPLMLTMLGLTALYVVVTEIAKKYFYSRLGNSLA